MELCADRNIRQVEEGTWRLAAISCARKERLLHSAEPAALLERLAADAEQSALQQQVELSWQRSDDFEGYFRLIAKVPLQEATFDELFNGRSGYRAQFYLSPEEGVLFNRDVLSALTRAIERAYYLTPLRVEWPLVRNSLRGPHAKLWVFDEKPAFDSAVPEALNPPRWVDSGKTRGRRAPLPEHLCIEVKGAFIHPEQSGFKVDDYKLDRACDIFRWGYT